MHCRHKKRTKNSRPQSRYRAGTQPPRAVQCATAPRAGSLRERSCGPMVSMKKRDKNGEKLSHHPFYSVDMAPSHREDAYVVVQPGENHTLVKFGLEDPLGLPSHSVPTKVWKLADGLYSMDEGAAGAAGAVGAVEVRPLVDGRIVDLGALQFLIKTLLNSFLKLPAHANVDLDQVHLVVVQTSTKWSHSAIEGLVHFLFEGLSLCNVSLVPLGLCAMFAHGSYPNALVVDVGWHKSEVIPIVDYEVFAPACRVVRAGGATINVSLQRLLPSLSANQIEALKRSDIYECLSAEEAQKSFYGAEGLVEAPVDEGVLDIAAIVTSDKSTREMLETVANSESEGKPNGELESNTFVDDNGETIKVGKERFQGCVDLVDEIVYNIYWGLEKIPDPRKRQECYENVVFAGKTTGIKGFKELVMVRLAERYLVTTKKAEVVAGAGANGAASAASAAGTAFRNTIDLDNLNVKQTPRHLRIIPKPDYFLDWKRAGFEDCTFLGAQVLAKQVFSNGLALTHQAYVQEGPAGIWATRL